MAEAMVAKDIVAELKAIREDLDFIKAHMVDVDTILNPKEEARLEESLKEYKTGKAVPLDEFEKAKRR